MSDGERGCVLQKQSVNSVCIMFFGYFTNRQKICIHVKELRHNSCLFVNVMVWISMQNKSTRTTLVLFSKKKVLDKNQTKSHC